MDTYIYHYVLYHHLGCPRLARKYDAGHCFVSV